MTRRAKAAAPAARRKSYDVIVVGAGSVGCPLAYFLAKERASVLLVDALPSPGQGQNKTAIGGVRATHSDPAKIRLCLDSIRIFSTWREAEGADIGWKKGGYCYPVFGEREEGILKGLLGVQKSFGLNIDWLGAEEIRRIVPGINSEGLRGGTYSPDDGQVSPLRAASSFVDVARRLGAEARFGERVTGFKVRGGKVHAVVTSAGEYAAATVVIASGAEARETGELLRLTFPVVPDSHEAGITAPVRPFLGPLVVDMRAGPEGKTANFYFGQNAEGQIIFCYTPSQLFYGTSREPTSEFLPVLARRMIGLIPAMKDVPVRRTWRGLYPMTPDGIIIVDRVRELEGVVVAIGMCGQGMMLGPGVARCVSGMVTGSGPTIDAGALAALSLYRDFHKGRVEALK